MNRLQKLSLSAHLGIKLSPSERSRLIECISKFKKARVLVIGDFMLDRFIWGTVERISPEAPVPVVHVKRESYMLGGSLNVAHNIRTLGGTVYPCGIVGRDLEGRMLLKTMRRNGIDIGGVIYDRNRPTVVKTRVIAHSQQVVRFDREKIEDVAREDLLRILKFLKRKIQDIDALIIEDYGKGLIQPFMLKEIIGVAKKYKKPVLVDPKEKHFSYYVGATALTPNRKEAYGGLENGGGHAQDLSIDQVGKKLIKKLSLEALLITLGEDGMMLFEKNGTTTKIPTVAREVYDVSGAGDTVIGVFALALAAGAKMKDAAILSNFAAGIVVGKLGTATVTPEELRAAVKQESQ